MHHHHQKVFAFLKLSFEYFSGNNFSTSLLPILENTIIIYLI